MNNVISEDLIFFLDVNHTDELFEGMFTVLHQKDFVKSSFLTAIKQREVEYPTGLATETIGVALPHTDAEHVKKEAIGIGILKNPITFRQMGMADANVQVNVVFMLALQKPENQLEVLQKITGLIQHNSFSEMLMNCSTKKQVITTIERFTKEVHVN
ncbi:PTS sugar transporter subunit IIA [Virgibacillus salarius]|uniref:PTS sugar transporter subunit IIA n=1 Tax=Virgibacillus salarius TaxID=447199 RepID=UPI002490A184|nr:PTS sugar transporter subunit IIA [Virgibacillus salarius]WBX82297.1 PTS sugar transporter subunit IIA [Virgibacillus salarius]